MFHFHCPFCEQSYEAEESMIGQIFSCTSCKKEIVVDHDIDYNNSDDEHKFKQKSIEEKINKNIPIDESKASKSNSDNFENDSNRKTAALQPVLENKPFRSPLSGSQVVKISLKKWKYLFLFLLLLAVLFGIFLYKYKKEQDSIEWCINENKKIMKEALLDLAKYPGSSEVHFDSYNDYPDANFLTASGYIDMANGFGVKKRYKFHFHVEKYLRWGGDNGKKLIKQKEDLGQISLEDNDGDIHFIHAEEFWDYNHIRRKK